MRHVDSGIRRYRFVISSLAAAIAAPPAVAQSHLYTVGAATTAEWCGYAVAPAGDANGDGCADFMVGRPRDSTVAFRAGRVTWISGKDGAMIRESYGDGAADEFGNSLARVGDVDGDGVSDVLVGAWLGDDAAGVQTGEAKVLSGATGTAVLSLSGGGGDHFGIAVTGLGDLDGDAVPDFAVGADQDDDNGLNSGGVHVFSGATGTLLLSIAGSESDVKLGSAIAGGGDADLDGVPDVIVATPWGGNSTAGYYGHVQLRSGTDGAVIREWFGASTLGLFGWSVAGPGDVDGDGRGDVLIGIRNAKPNGNASGAAHLYSGGDGALIHAHNGLTAGAYLGTSVAAAGDVDGDGVPDVLLGAPGSGTVRIHSGGGGASIGGLSGKTAGDSFGWAVAGGGDLNGDGAPDVLIGAHDGVSLGYAQAFAATTLSLASDVHEVSTNAGGTQAFALDAGTANAGRTYILLGSVSGTSPGLPVFPVVLPLNFDPYLLYTAAYPNTAPLTNSYGTLDGMGRASAAFTMPLGFPQFAGVKLHHAYLLLAPNNFASNPVPLSLVD